jgi:hypothetical protein
MSGGNMGDVVTYNKSEKRRHEKEIRDEINKRVMSENGIIPKPKEPAINELILKLRSSTEKLRELVDFMKLSIKNREDKIKELLKPPE